jgi:uncharacterized membrane protein YphA (DoxX/SURF4 family)
VSKRFSMGFATVIMLVMLRLTIGWHFFSEGAKHYADPHWTSEPTLRAATGPLAPWFHAYLPDFHGFEELLHGQRSQSDSHAVQGWIDEIQTDWNAFRGQFGQHYALNESQQTKAKAVLTEYQEKLRQWAAANRDALETHVHEWQRKETTQQTPASDMPFQKRRIAEKLTQLTAQANGWRAELKGLEHDYDNALDGLLDDQQHGQRPLPHHTTSIDVVDDVMTYVILGVGLLLLLGLFTRLACLSGALFLLSVVMMQPFWVSAAMPTFNQSVEMLALLTLATTPVGRWGGLDFFIHSLISGSCCTTKGKSDAPQS